jgi:PTS system mannose-specific IIA component
MIGIVLVTHGRLAEELRSAMEHVVGAQRGVATICIGADDDVEQRRQEIRHRIAEVDCGDGVVIVTDMFGGTPSNLAISMMDRPNVEVLAGANLPMLVKLAKARSRYTLAECVAFAEAAGRKNIVCASAVLRSGATPNLCMMDPRQPGSLPADTPPLKVQA